MDAFCFKWGKWENTCEKYNEFVKGVVKYDPGALDLMEKNDDVQELKQPTKQTPRTVRGRAIRRKTEIKKQRKKKRIILQDNSYNPFRGYIEYGEENGQWKPVGKYIKYIGKSNGQRYLKKKTNKRIRRIPVDEERTGRKNNKYRKESGVDYWWELFWSRAIKKIKSLKLKM